MNSPLCPILKEDTTLPEPFRIQFLHAPEFNYDVLIKGELDEVWFRPIWLAPLFWLLERLGILIAERAEKIETTLRVIAKYDQNGAPYQLWLRRFYGPRTKKFDVKVVFDEESHRPVDLVGPKGLLALAWHIRRPDQNTINIDVVGAGLHHQGKYLWLPDWLWPLLLGREEFTQTADPHHKDRISIDLHIKHPLFGSVFCYKGTFKVTKARHN